MSSFTDDELIDYVIGKDGARGDEIAVAAAADEELAAQLALMRMMSGRPVIKFPVDAPPAEIVSGIRALAVDWKRHRRKTLVAAAVAAIVTFVAGGVWAGWSYLHRPLLEDHFLRRTFDSLRWAAPRPQVRPEYVYIKLTNRGYLVTQQEFEGPIELSFRWRWLDLAENPLYSDNLTVTLRTTGEPSEESPFNIKDGVMVVFSTYDSRVMVTGKPIADPPGVPHVIQRRTEMGQVPMPSERWHDIRIRDDGTTIQVFVSGPELPSENAKKSVLSVSWPLKERGRKIAFFNREMLKWAAHESHITDVVVRTLRP
ncbi:hypothetical protein BH10PLA2_BH10PLA2_23690 [soil metagenome]